MGWSSTFIAAISARRRGIQYILEVIEVYGEPGTSYKVASHAGLGADVRLGIRGVQVQPQTLQPRTWTSTLGAWSVDIVGEIQTLCQNMARGSIVRLLAGFDGWSADDFEPIALGQVRNLRGRGSGRWRLECLDFYSACKQRLGRSYGLWQLFSDQGTSTTIASVAYTPGDTSLQVASTTGFSRETGGSGLLRITPSAGSPFYLTYTGTATGPVRFTGLSAAGVMGTTAVAASVGDAVAEAAYLSGHPINILRKILASRATSNGSYDVYPSQWGLGILDELIDHDDCDRWRDEVVKVSSGSYTWQRAETAAVDDAFSYLQGILSPAGIFLRMRQGLLSCGAAQLTYSPLSPSGISITDSDIEEVEDWEAWESNHSPEYGYMTVEGDTALIGLSATTDTATLPADTSLSYDLSSSVFSNETAICTEVRDRLYEGVLRVPERLTLRCAGLRLAQLGPGEVVEITTTRAHSKRDGDAGYSARAALIDELGTDWDGGRVRVGLLVYPEDDELYS